MGLQAARGIQSFRQNTYHRMSVNASVQYRPDDFIEAIRQQSLSQGDINEKLDRFINRVQYKVEEALQSNELINVFQDDFEMIGDEEAAVGTQSSALNMVPRSFFEQEYCKSKTVSCIRFHPTKEHLVAMSLVERFNTFEDRVNLLGISFEAYVLILNFKDPEIILLNYILQTPVEITSFEFHPENPNVVMGGAINGQVVAWDLGSINHRITNQGGRKPTIARMPDEEEDKTQQTAVKLKQLILSNIERSHKSYVSDIQFVPKNVKVDKRAGITGRQDFFMSCCEDGWVHIWDTRSVTVEELAKQTKRFEWMPLISINVHRQDGSGEVGLSKLLFQSEQDTPTFYATSDEGDLMLIDWSIKPLGDDAKIAENVRMTRDSERSYRPTLAL
jgi:dynein intermediate chain 3, axonemal